MFHGFGIEQELDDAGEVALLDGTFHAAVGDGGAGGACGTVGIGQAIGVGVGFAAKVEQGLDGVARIIGDDERIEVD